MKLLKNIVSKPELKLSTLFRIIVDELKIISFDDNNNLSNKILQQNRLDC